MNRKTHLICESVQEVTLYAWDIVWDNNKYDQDSREVLEMLRNWGEEFEKWWESHDEEWICSHDYCDEVWDFTQKKCNEFLKRFQ